MILGLGAGWNYYFRSPVGKANGFLDRGEADRAVEVLVDGLNRRRWSSSDEENIRILLAQAYYTRGALESAEEQLRILDEKFSKSFETSFLRGLIFWIREQDRFARESFEEARNMSPEDPRPYYFLGKLFLTQNDLDSAEKIYRDFLNRWPQSIMGIEGIALVDFNRGRFTEAVQAFEKLGAASPQDMNTWHRLASGLAMAGETRLADRLMEAIYSKNPKDERYSYYRGLRAWQLGNRTEAEQIFRDLYSQNRNFYFGGISLMLLAGEREDWVYAQSLQDELGSRLPKMSAGEGYFTATTEQLHRLIEYRSNLQNLQITWDLALAKLAFWKGEYQESEKLIRLVLSSSSRDLSARRFLVTLRKAQGLPQEALKMAEQNLTYFPDHPLCLLDRAEIMLDLGKTKEAESEAQRVANFLPEFSLPQALLARIYVAESKALRNAEPDTRALVAAQRALTKNPDSADSQWALALAIADEDSTGALTAYLQALRIDSRRADIQYSLAQQYHKWKQPQLAKKYLAEAQRLEPQRYRGRGLK